MASATDVFTTLLAGGLQGAVKRKREVEVQNIQRKENELQRKFALEQQWTAALTRLAPHFTQESIASVIPQVTEKIRAGEAPGGSFAQLEQRPPEPPKPPSLSAKSSLLNNLTDAVNRKDLSIEQAKKIAQREGLGDIQFQVGRQPQKRSGTDKLLNTMAQRSDDLRLEIETLRKRKNEKTEFGTLARDDRERKNIERQINARLKTLRGIDKRRATLTGVPFEEAQKVKIEDFPKELSNITTLIQSSSFTDQRTRGALINDVADRLKKIGTEDEAAQFLFKLVKERRLNPDDAATIMETFKL